MLVRDYKSGLTGTIPQITVDFLTREIGVSLIVFAAVFIAGFYIVQKRSVK